MVVVGLVFVGRKVESLHFQFSGLHHFCVFVFFNHKKCFGGVDGSDLKGNFVLSLEPVRFPLYTVVHCSPPMSGKSDCGDSECLKYLICAK